MDGWQPGPGRFWTIVVIEGFEVELGHQVYHEDGQMVRWQTIAQPDGASQGRHMINRSEFITPTFSLARFGYFGLLSDILLGAALLVLVGVLFAQGRLVAKERPTAGERHSFVLLPRSLFALGMLAFCVLLVEGAISDWSAVYLRESLGSPPTEAALGFVVFNFNHLGAILELCLCQF